MVYANGVAATGSSSGIRYTAAPDGSEVKRTVIRIAGAASGNEDEVECGLVRGGDVDSDTTLDGLAGCLADGNAALGTFADDTRGARVAEPVAPAVAGAEDVSGDDDGVEERVGGRGRSGPGAGLGRVSRCSALGVDVSPFRTTRSMPTVPANAPTSAAAASGGNGRWRFAGAIRTVAPAAWLSVVGSDV